MSFEGGTEPVWAPDGRELFYRLGDAILAVPVRQILLEFRFESLPTVNSSLQPNPLHGSQLNRTVERPYLLRLFNIRCDDPIGSRVQCHAGLIGIGRGNAHDGRHPNGNVIPAHPRQQDAIHRNVLGVNEDEIQPRHAGGEPEDLRLQIVVVDWPQTCDGFASH